MNLDLYSISEKRAGAKWQKLFQRHWSAYKAWFLSKEDANSPDLETSRARLKEYMPEFYPTYLKLCELAGPDPVAHRFLTGYRPPAYISGCAQVVHEDEAQLVRNYDFDPNLSEGTLLLTHWNERAVMGMGDCLCGIVDGINSDGLVVSLTFGGRKVVGDGFGIPFILRFVLEFCATLDQAEAALKRIPSHMSYNVMLMNAKGEHRLLQMAPDHNPRITELSASTNHQGTVDWPEHAAFTKTIERELYLHEMLAQGGRTGDQIADEFLRAPLFNRKYRLGFGTIYTAVYRAKEGALELRWPGVKLRQTFAEFSEGITSIRYSETAPPASQLEEVDHDGAEAYWAAYGRNWATRDISSVTDAAGSSREQPKNDVAERIQELLAQMARLSTSAGAYPWQEVARQWSELGASAISGKTGRAD